MRMLRVPRTPLVQRTALRHEESRFVGFFREVLASGGALPAIDTKTQRTIGQGESVDGEGNSSRLAHHRTQTSRIKGGQLRCS